MPIPAPVPRREVHHRTVDLKVYEREDGLFDVEARLIDTKPFDFDRVAATEAAIPAHSPIHDLRLRMTINADYVIQDVCAASDTTPYGRCKEAETTLSGMIGERVGKGWSNLVKSKLRGTASCTHLMELLIPMATAAIQGVSALRPIEERRGATGIRPPQLDSCYAYDSRGPIVMKIWPEYYRKPDQESP